MALLGAALSQRDAFEAAVRCHSRALFAMAFTILRDVQEAEDAVQDSMELAWRGWGSLRDPERRDAWITRICVRRCLRIRRGLLRRVFLSETDLRRFSEPVDPVDPDLDRAYRRLSPHQRAVITLHYHHGYALDECGTLMGCRPGTVRSHLARALAALRKELTNE